MKNGGKVSRVHLRKTGAVAPGALNRTSQKATHIFPISCGKFQLMIRNSASEPAQSLTQGNRKGKNMSGEQH